MARTPKTVPAPVPARRGRKPMQQAEATLPSLLEDEAPPAPAQDDALIAEMAYPVSAGEGSGTPPPDPAPATPAAQWDKATDAVRFDWPEIERTASQDGPNQVMAKLLVAARAEGANSRWPL